MRIDVVNIKYQPDCIFIYTTDKVDSSIEVLPFRPVCPGYEKTKCVIKSADRKELEKTINIINSYPQLRYIKIISKKDNSAELCLITNTTELYKEIRDSGGFILGTMSVDGGKERWLVTFEDLNSRKRAVNYLKDTSDVNLTSTIDIPPEFFCWLVKSYEDLIDFFNTIRSLKSSQLKLFREIVENGYYEWPRRVNITEISKREKISKAAVSRKIRSVERSILNNIVNIIRDNKF